MWLTVSAVTSMLVAADLGVSSGMVQPLAAVVSDDRRAAQRIVSSAFFVLTAISVALVVVFAAVYPFIDWKATFNVSSLQAASEAGPTAAVAMLCLAGSITAGIAIRVNSSFQEGPVNNFWQTAGNVVGVAALFTATRWMVSLPILVLTSAVFRCWQRS